MSDENSGEASWKDSLPEQIREAPYFKNAESVDQVLADLSNAAAWQGNSIRIPGPDAGPDDIKAFQQKAIEKLPGLMPTPNAEDPDAVTAILGKLGAPESPDGYRAPDNVDEAAIADLRAYAHEAKLTDAQFQQLASQMASTRQSAAEKAASDLEAQYTTLKTEWGAAYESRMQDVGKLLANAPESVQQAYRDNKLPTDQVRWLHTLSELGSEEAQVPGQEESREPIMTPGEATEQLAEVERRLFDRNTSPEEKKMLQDKRLKLMALSQGLAELPPMRVIEG
jgi:hypothetical protein